MKKRTPPPHKHAQRTLTEDERELWHQVARTIRPTRKPAPETLAPPAGDAGGDPGVKRMDDGPPARPRPQLPAWSPQPQSPQQNLVPMAIDERSARKILRGQLSIDDRIDLHGMTQAEAHLRLARFLRSAHERGLRHVLVITGKGRLGEGILRKAVPAWLREPQLAAHVSAFRTAHVSHGGDGALYVRLRRRHRASGDRSQ